ncbi:MAG: anaerobic sulfatase maturase [Spirochaetes bacterium]|nr:anaerobic sulfatase maturase [Spirochaetota bacterium]
MGSLSFLVKPVSYHCNLACNYCFYKRVVDLYPGSLQIMPFDVAETLIKAAIGTGSTYILFCWQGGEPTLAGLEFFKEIVTVQNRLKTDVQIIENSLQTNGILLNEEWCEFLSRNNVLVGISLDGPEVIHDTYRRDYAGHGTFEKVMHAIALMNEYAVQYNILTLVTNANVTHARELYAFFRHNNFAYLQFIPCFEHDEKGNIMPYSISGKDLGNFYCELFDAWYQDGFPYVSVRLFQDLLMYSLGAKTSCCWLGECNSYIVVEHNGDCYPCDFFVYPEWHLGNIMNYRLQDILNNEKRNTFAQLKRETTPECSVCSINNFCMGDCTRYRFTTDIHQRGTSKLCEAWKMLFEHYQHYEKELVERVSKLQKSVQTGKFFQLQRNDICPCGSGKKFKKCCGRAPLAI